MKKIILILLSLIFLFGNSCNETITKDEARTKLQELLHISISDNITITNYEEDAAIGSDFTEAFVAHFNHEEFSKIFKAVNPPRFKNIDIELYGYTVQEKNKRISAIFNPKENTIKYTYNSE